MWITALLCLWALAIAAIDWQQRRVPNVLLLALLLPAVAVLAWRGTGILGIGWLPSLLGLALALALTLPGYALSRFGAGDVKLAAVMGLVLGWPLVVYALLVAGLLMGLGALLMVLMAGLPSVRALRLPTAWTLLTGFVAVLLWQAGGW